MLYEESLKQQKVPDFSSWFCQVKEYKREWLFPMIEEEMVYRQFLMNAHIYPLGKYSKYKNRTGTGFLCKTSFSCAKIDRSRHID